MKITEVIVMQRLLLKILWRTKTLYYPNIEKNCKFFIFQRNGRCFNSGRDIENNGRYFKNRPLF